ncbi:alpha-N-arabinofuranosidase [Granulicella sp. WH15]|uniref:alpha-L-arabinofuranosidase C-terminal domain-containing protein n=1 Tax=Granulicella sp. WH15 TaxID=2602070 RepID=UPI0013677DB4|nr:alpha-L-arabinofuranosidase C-terminal domain-containing protein [Granulicella sp. WH15]QHN03282.1 alpha-N-arabinofuranosidase [Granulicella sp. WH15]
MRFASYTVRLSSALLFASSFLHAQAPASGTLDIDLGTPLHKVSPMLYGLMTEEINYSYDGGLYAEMVRNRTFQENDHRYPARWFITQGGFSSAAMEVDPTTGPSAALHQSLKVTVAHADSANQAGVLNEGYWGMAVRPETTYTGSFYARPDATMAGPVTVSLISNKSGAAVASATVPALSTGWKQYSYTMKTGQLQAGSDYHLAITFAHPGTVWLCLVSLFPPTYKNRDNGNRPDLMEKMAAMKPRFLRLPGGNYLEGDEIWQRYEFKTTIGPLVDRPTHPSPWRYRSSDGMGLLEFLEWCEDLGIEPVLAVYAGYSMHPPQFINPGPNLDPYVEDALDEIEYVIGPTNTKWGAVRAKNGHPKPFPLTYVEIGNEDWFDKSGSYDGRFAQFNKAIKARYPQLQTVATTAVNGVKPDVIDDHYYERATDIFKESLHYDKADRNGPKIFVGEWATREGSPTPNFGAALGDAAWMTSMERNSDLIIMSAYAPLLVNVNPGGMQWESDLIGYDAMSSYGSPSYYAQVLFGNHLGSEVPTNSISGVENPRFFYSVTSDAGKVYLKLVNASTIPQPLNIKIAGAGKLASTASLLTLTAKDTTDTNTLTDPERIVPVAGTLSNVGATFTHTVPAYSIQVVEIPRQ